MLTNTLQTRNRRRSATVGGRGSKWLRTLDRTVAVGALRTLGVARRARPLGTQLERIGLMKTAGIGDMILLSAVAEDVIAAFPGAQFVVVAGPENAGLAELIPRSRVLTLPTAHPWKAIPILRAERFDALIDFGQWTRVEALYTALSAASWTAGFETREQRRHYAYDATATHRDDVPELENFRELVSRLGIRSTSVPHFDPHLGAAPVTAEPYVVLHMWPGGFRSELREWPAERWRALADALSAEGLKVVLTGGPGDVERTARFIASAGESRDGIISVAGRYRLSEMVGVLAAARCVISVNTGMMHMAAAAGTPTVALNGPTSSRRWGAIGLDVVNLDSELEGCGFLNLGFEYDGRRLDCMEGIGVERVLAAVRERVYA
jgi:ADP-heptose:LPS heptosyltransferase